VRTLYYEYAVSGDFQPSCPQCYYRTTFSGRIFRPERGFERLFQGHCAQGMSDSTRLHREDGGGSAHDFMASH